MKTLNKCVDFYKPLLKAPTFRDRVEKWARRPNFMHLSKKLNKVKNADTNISFVYKIQTSKKFNSGLFDVAFSKYTQRLQSTWDLELKLIADDSTKTPKCNSRGGNRRAHSSHKANLKM
jgi:hypothetical protein